ncbi:MAG: ATP-dependent helicase HrpB [Proteobacteria bacterium]|nr:ATP-dependent helicase HrpB [Pseudomonadota bacterium]MBU1687804.1 ATP-dependent helicase HrpB [Pseudomonadota bacterium]
MGRLPIAPIIPDLLATLALHPRVIVSAPPGSGKTTGLPLCLLDAPWLAGRRILLLEPRRLAARMAANWMASLLDEPVGQTVGYRIRLEKKISSATRIEVVTEGILTRMLQDDPSLAQIGAVIFDEFHERSIHADLALALCLDMSESLREDLRILIMSATLELDPLHRLLDEAPLICGQGESYPVALRYLPPALTRQQPNHLYDFQHTVRITTAAVIQAFNEQGGDLLVFLPGIGEIKAVADRLGVLAQEQNCLIRPLYGDLSGSLQDEAIRPGRQRRIVLATSIAETSLTIEGITTVVDAGYRRSPRFDPNCGMTRLITERVSQAGAKQRAGRAGRLGPGICYRLWAEAFHQTLPPHNRPEILEADLCRLALELCQWGVKDPSELAWLDLPPAGPYAQAITLLHDLGAVDGNGSLTPHGQKLATLPLHPRLGHLLLIGAELGQLDAACDLAALLSERDPILPAPHGERSADLELRFMALAAFRQGRQGELRSLNGDLSSCRRIDQVSKRLHQLGNQPKKHPNASFGLGSLLVYAYPDRVANCRPDSPERYLLAGGRGARLAIGDPLAGLAFIVAPIIDAGHREGRIFLAAEITLKELRDLHHQLISSHSKLYWDERDCLVSRKEERIGAIVLSTTPQAVLEPNLMLQALLTRIRKEGLSILPWDRKARNFQARINSLRCWQPEAGWPDLFEATLLENLEDWLAPYLNNLLCLSQLASLNLLAILEAGLSWEQRNLAAQLTPVQITVPSGTRHPLEYTDDGRSPILSVRLQEMFGLEDTPLVCNRIPVLLHLLSPASRPVQVTSDLRGFWDTTYPLVKKELQGRYPRHHWPGDPRTAPPTARIKKKKN